MPLLLALAEAFSSAGFVVLRCDLPFRQQRSFGPPRPADAARDRLGLKNAIAELRNALAGKGHRIAIGDLDGDAAAATALQLGQPHLGLPLDVTKSESFTAFFDAAEREQGPLEVLINNASLLGPTPLPLLLDYPAEDFRRVLATNLEAPFVLIQRLLPALLEASGSVTRFMGRLRIEASPVRNVQNGWPASTPSRRRAIVPELPQSMTSSGSCRPPSPTPSTR